MFGHLKAGEFTKLIEGTPLKARRETHLARCGRCRSAWKAIDAAEGDPPEPDWTEFRAAVRDVLLSRSVRREQARGKWVTPAGILALAIGLIAAVYVGNRSGGSTPPDAPTVAAAREHLVRESIEAERAVWSNVSVFEEIASLGPEEAERFRRLLEAETRNPEASASQRQ
jgi:hypothetical protein